MDATRVLVVGANGATGRCAVRELAEAGWPVRALVRDPARLPWEPDRWPSVEVVAGAVAGFGPDDFRQVADGCAAAICCLGHNLTLRGLFGPPRNLVSDALAGMAAALAERAQAQPSRLVLMGTTAVTDPRQDEPAYSGRDHFVLGLLDRWLPPQRDNRLAARRLLDLHPAGGALEWVVLRPDTLIDEASPAGWSLVSAPTCSPVSGSGRTSRIHVAQAMRQLLADDSLWEQWRFRMPVLYNR